MAYFKKYCGCLLDFKGAIMLPCKNPDHKLDHKLIYTNNGIDAKKVQSKDLTGEDIAGIMFIRMTGTIR